MSEEHGIPLPIEFGTDHATDLVSITNAGIGETLLLLANVDAWPDDYPRTAITQPIGVQGVWFTMDAITIKVNDTLYRLHAHWEIPTVAEWRGAMRRLLRRVGERRKYPDRWPWEAIVRMATHLMAEAKRLGRAECMATREYRALAKYAQMLAFEQSMAAGE